ncbi:MAG: ATP-binding cassette domain-containing protein [Acidobacteria bacterium]|nr:ATP-binding cassette domain-containing protein [Acidobacteriota bacterium]
MTGPIHVRLCGVWKAFGPRQVLRGVDLAIERGRVNILTGGSGQGKSLLLDLLTGKLQPDAGEILVEGEDMGVLGQHSALEERLTVAENVARRLRERRRPAGARRLRGLVGEMLRRLGIPESDYGKFPAQIPPGVQRRVALACAMVTEPKILVCDEPTTALDPIAARQVEEALAGAASRLGTTVIVVTLDLSLAFRIGHRISVLEGGRIVASGTPHKLAAKPGPAVRRLIEALGPPVGWPSQRREG